MKELLGVALSKFLRILLFEELQFCFLLLSHPTINSDLHILFLNNFNSFSYLLFPRRIHLLLFMKHLLESNELILNFFHTTLNLWFVNNSMFFFIIDLSIDLPDFLSNLIHINIFSIAYPNSIVIFPPFL